VPKRWRTIKVEQRLEAVMSALSIPVSEEALLVLVQADSDYTDSEVTRAIAFLVAQGKIRTISEGLYVRG
jgi:hypothetical protein